MRSLVKYADYTREEISHIFDPGRPFTPQAGTWGLRGMIRVPHRKGDFVFFVTVGKRQAHHVFREHITESGILTWQSQPSQTLSSPLVREWIRHDHLTNSIHLFFRTRNSVPYTYMGRLAYVSHDGSRERPVYFRWQILNWCIPASKLAAMGLELADDVPECGTPQGSPLQRTSPPTIIDSPKPGPDYHTVTMDFAENESWDETLKEGGELLVLENEKMQLSNDGRPDLAARVIHTSRIQGDCAGYNIQSYFPDGTVKYIEVKTTAGGAGTPFTLTANELSFSKTNSCQYQLVRVYAFEKKGPSAKYFVLEGDLTQHLSLRPIEFRATLK